MVVPMPAEAKTGQNSPCSPPGETEELYPCHFGVPAERGDGTIALVGDSHAAHWRAAVDVVAHQRGWHGISLTQTGCPMTKAIPILNGRQRDDCLGYNESIGPWLERHPEVSSVFTSQHGGKVVKRPRPEPARGADRGLPPRVLRAAAVDRAGHRDPRHAVEHGLRARCIEHALAAGRRPDGAARSPASAPCARPRRGGGGAHGLPARAVLDLTPFMCGRDKCFPVVGGALVHKDGGHVTQVFSRTLGPYLGRYIAASSRRPRAASYSPSRFFVARLWPSAPARSCGSCTASPSGCCGSSRGCRAPARSRRSRSPSGS